MGNQAAGRRAFRLTTPDGAMLSGSIEGDGPPLLLVSGLGGTAAFWNDSAVRLSQSFCLIRFDQRGIGASTRGTAFCDIDQLARDCIAVLDEAGVEACAVLGHSTGGCIGQRLGCQAPERVTGLILSATWLKPSRYMAALFGTRRAILDANPEAYAATATLLAYPPAWLEANWSRYETAVAKGPVSAVARRIVAERIDALLAFDGSVSVGALTMPTLVLGAKDDVIVPAFLQEELAAALPRAATTMLEDGGHFFPISRPDEFTAAVQNWLP